MIKKKPKPFSVWFPLLGLFIAQVAWGVAQCFTDNGAVYWLFTLLLASMATMWAVFDAQHRGKPLLHIVQFLMLILWVVAVPIYLVTTRGLLGFGWTLLNVVGLIIANMSGYYATVLAVWGPDAIWPPG